MDNTKFDDILMGMLQHCEQVEPFLDAIFSFLARRTDFFRLMLNPEDKMGFPPGVAEKMVLKIFKAYQQIVLGTKANSSTEAANKSSGARKKKTKTDATSSATLHELPSTSQSVEEAASVNTSQPATREEERNIVPPAVTSVEVETSPADQPEAAPPSTTTAVCATPPVGEASADAGAGAAASASSESPSIPSHQEEKSTESQGLMPGKSDECYNGAVLDKYTWSQTIRDIDVRIPVSSTITKARDVGVEIKSSHLKVWLKKGVSPGESNTIVDGKLQRTIKNEESFWSLEPGNCILVNLEKAEERFWTAVLEGDAEIDKTKVDTTRDISDFDEQTQTDFQRVMFDHHQKLQGKPTSQEAKTHDLLKQAWNAKGSPFAGTEFDPSKVNVSPSYG